MKISKKALVLVIVFVPVIAIFVFGLYLNYGNVGGTDVAKANGDCKRFMELENHFESHDELYDAFQAGQVDCNILDDSFLSQFLKVYRTDVYECSIVETQLRYPDPKDYLAAMDAGTDKCVGHATGEFVAAWARDALRLP